MKKVWTFLSGKKTYLVGILIAVLGVLEGTGTFTIPEYVWPILAAAGLGFMRSGINKVSNEVKQ